MTRDLIRLLLVAGGRHSSRTSPGDVSVSVFDRPSGRRWVRTPPTIQVEGGSYTLAEARRLVRARSRS
jgi:hypothetical protein